jgi:hypothetical protein
MVGIKAGKGFTLLQDIDQFALCGISPETKLNFDELHKQAIRVAALLHDDFKKPAGTVVPFSSATANDLKGWLQGHATGARKKPTAIKLFYASTAGHRGLTWQPYLKGQDGALLPRSSPAIWQTPSAKMPTPPATPSPPKMKKRGRPNADDETPAVPERKRRAYAYSGHDANLKDDTCHTTSSTHSEPTEANPSTSTTTVSLTQLLRLGRDPARHRVAVAVLPDREGRIVTVKFDKGYGVYYQIQNVNIHGDTLFAKQGRSSYKSIQKQRGVFLGRFAGASQEELLEFAMELSKDTPNAELPLRDRSPTRKASV